MKIKTSVAAVIFSLFVAFSASAFDAEDIVSPASGLWCNQQPLVLDVHDGSDVYYSLSGTDPMTSGFAYDGPVVINQTGNVQVKITSISPEGSRSDFTVSYIVQKPDFNKKDISKEDSSFLQQISESPVIKMVSGSRFSIPEDLSYYLGNKSSSFSRGRELFTSPGSLLDRYVPCIVTDGNNSWRFILHTAAVEAPAVITRTVPFEISNWTDFTFTGEKLIYQVDDSFWSASVEPLTLDRSVSHVIRWQSIEYTEGNPVQVFVLPPEPYFNTASLADGSVCFYSDSSDPEFALKVSVKDSDFIKPGFYSNVNLDVLQGDELSGILHADVYYANVYQGSVERPFEIDRQPPSPPVIQSSAGKNLARNKVTLTVSAENNCQIYYGVSNPLVSETGFDEVPEEKLQAVTVDDYKLYDGTGILLKSSSGKASFYKVRAYAQDKSSNVSTVTEYTVVVDEFNYYLACDSFENNGREGDGSYSNPFTSLDRALEAVNSQEKCTLHVKGTVPVSGGVKTIRRDCAIKGSQCTFVFAPDASIRIENAAVSISNAVLQKTSSNAKNGDRFLSASDSNLTISGCEIFSSSSADSILIDCSSCSVEIEDSGLTLQSLDYGCILSSADCTVELKNCRLTCSAETAVGVSAGNGTLNLNASRINVLGNTGRCVEVYGAAVSASGNVFSGKLKSASKNLKLFYSDSKCTLINYSDNDETRVQQ